MSVYAIGDLHLSGAVDKPMDIFGAEWENHWTKIIDDWEDKVTDEDIVLLPGDLSWAMTLEQAKVDIDSIGKLPGKKVMIKGNHDYWWSSISRVRQVLPPAMSAIQNDSVTIGDYTVCGTRGWSLPDTKGFTEHDQKIYTREKERLKLSLEHAKANKESDKLILMLHYPPFDDKGRASGFIDIISQNIPQHVVYGHLHDMGTRNAYEGLYKSTEYHLVSCDYLDFTLKQIV